MKIAGADLSITSSGVVVEEVDDKFNIQNLERHGLQLSRKMLYYQGWSFTVIKITITYINVIVS